MWFDGGLGWFDSGLGGLVEVLGGLGCFNGPHMEYPDHKVVSLGDLRVRDDTFTLIFFKDMTL